MHDLVTTALGWVGGIFCGSIAFCALTKRFRVAAVLCIPTAVFGLLTLHLLG